jgi:nicotinamide phosphoribosyltransferase
MAGNSIPASEHSVVGSWGGPAGEPAFMENMIDEFARPGAFWACVSDTYDLWNAIDNLWDDRFRQKLIDSGSTLVVRPDSGDPTVIPIEVVERLGTKFGFSVNQKGFKVLNTVRVIQGDGIDGQTIRTILQKLKDRGWAADNISFGMGGALVQKGIDRDTLKWAMKCSHITIDGQGSDVYKDPVTDPGKRSKRGVMALVHEAGAWETVPLDGNGYRDQLHTVYRNGMILRDEAWDDVCVRSAASFAEEFALRARA